jgi:hypothetical protein
MTVFAVDLYFASSGRHPAGIAGSVRSSPILRTGAC